MYGRIATFVFLAAAAFFPCFAQEKFARYRDGFQRGVLALQIQLDRRNLSCNQIDGCWGRRTEIALMAWQAMNGKEPDGVPTDAILEELGGETNVLRDCSVTSADLAKLAAVPADWEGKSRLNRLWHSTLREQYAERFHCTPRLLERLNPKAPWPDPPAGTLLLVPNVAIPKRKVLQTKADSLRISLSRMEITAFDNDGSLIALFPCSIAKEKRHRPSGELAVRNIAMLPTYTYDPQLFYPGTKEKTKLIIPPGPKSPVGTAWIGLSLPGYGMHGTPSPEKIGQAASHGCFRLANWNAEKLAHMVEPGVPVVVEE